MYFPVVACHQPDFTSRAVARIHNPYLVLRARVETTIMHAKRRFLQSLGMVPPRASACARWPEPDQRGPQKRRILIEARAAQQMRLFGEIAEIIIETAWPGIAPVQNLITAREAIGFKRPLPQFIKSLSEPQTIVQ